MWNKSQKANDKRVHINIVKRQVYIHGAQVDLPFKPQQVLCAILEAAPQVITREKLINRYWGGNFITGEKGLTQALWMIRAQLQELGGDSSWITTIPRYGYQWVGSTVNIDGELRADANVILRWVNRTIASAAVLAVAASIVVLNQALTVDMSLLQARQSSEKIVASNGTYAYFEEDNLTVQHIEGCVIKLEPTSGSRLMSPVFSDDGTKLAINLLDENRCRMRVVEFKTRSVEEFNYCLDIQSI